MKKVATSQGHKVTRKRRFAKYFFIKAVVFAALVFSVSAAWAQETEEIAVLKAKVEGKAKGWIASLEDLARVYYGANDYDGFYQYLKTLAKSGFASEPNVAYFLAHARQQQIFYWQQTKNWEGVYDQAPALRKEIAEDLTRAEKYAEGDPVLLLKIQYLRWQNTKDDDPDTAAVLFGAMIEAAKDLSGSDASLAAIKSIADDLASLTDKSLSRRFYEAYGQKLAVSDLSAKELQKAAEDFLGQGNAFLAKTLFDLYFQKLPDDAEARASSIVGVAHRFANNGWTEGIDPVHAESLYQKAYDLAGAPAFSADDQYGRALNLERLKEYDAAFEEYKNLIGRYEGYSHRAKILFRLAVIAAYGQKDIDLALDFFSKTKNEFPEDLAACQSLYQLGLLSQYRGEKDTAKEFYQAFLASAENQGLDMAKNELVLMAKERLKEIDEEGQMSYALRLFLDGTFERAESSLMEGTVSLPGGITADLTAFPAKQYTAGPVKFVVTTSNSQTGCMMPVYSYEWSGEVGGIANVANSPELPTAFETPGIKVTHVAVVGTKTPEAVGFEMAEIE